MPLTLPTIVQRLVLDPSGYVAGSKTAAASLGGVSGAMTKFGASMTKWVTLPVLAGGAAALVMGTKFESAFAKIEGLVGASGAQLDRYRDAVLKLGTETSRGPQELAESLYYITSSGQKGATALDTLNQSARAAAAGLGETQTVADAVTSAMNAYGKEVLSAEEATDIMIATVREGKAEPEQLAGSIGRVIAPAQLLGITFDQVGASIAGLTLVGLDAYESVTALRNIMRVILDPSKQAKEALLQVGLSADEIRKSVREKGLFQTMMDLKEAFKGNKAALGDLFENVRGLNGFMALTGKNAKQVEQIFAELTRTTGDTDHAFEVASETTQFKLNKALAELQTAAINLSAPFMEVAGVVAKAFGFMGKAISALPAPLRSAVVGFALFAAAIGPVLYISGKLIDAWRLMSKGVGLILDVIGKMLVPTKTLQTAMAGMGVTTEMVTMRQNQAAGSGIAMALGFQYSGAAATTAAAGYRTAMIALGAVALILGIAAVAFGLFSGGNKEAEERTKTFTDALKDNTSTVRKNIEAVLEKALADANQLDDLRDLGMTTYDVSRAVHGSAKAYAYTQDQIAQFAITNADLNQELKDSGFTLREVAQGLRGVDGAVIMNTQSGRDLIQRIKGESEEYVGLIENIRDQRHALVEATMAKMDAAVASGRLTEKEAKEITSIYKLKSANQDYLGAAIAIADATNNQVQKVEALGAAYETTKGKIEATLGVLLGARQAQLSTSESTRSLSEALKDAGGDWAFNGAETDKVKGSLYSVVDALIAEQEALVKNGEISVKSAQNNDFLRFSLLHLKSQFPALGGLIDEFLGSLGGVPAAAGDAATMVGPAFAGGVASSIPYVDGSFTRMSDAARTGMDKTKAAATQGGVDAGTAFGTSTGKTGIQSVKQATALMAGVFDYWTKFTMNSLARQAGNDVGISFAWGIVTGLQSRTGIVEEAMRRIIKDGVAAAKLAAGINSPSKVFMDIGQLMGAGLVVGLDSMTSEVARASTGLSDAAILGPGSPLMTAVPTVTPVAVPAGTAGAAGGASSIDQSLRIDQTNHIAAFDPAAVAELVGRETAWRLRTSGRI